MLKYLFLLLFVGTAFAQKLSLDERRSKIIGIIDEELSEVSRLARQQDYRDPNILMRMSELNLEKARLWRETENEKYLSIEPEKRRDLDKDDFFKRSTKYFNEANQSAGLIIKKHPNYKGLAEVYYILAYNSKELGRHQDAQKYFKLASQKGGSDKKLNAKSRLALADYYYNDKRYKEAVPLYESSIGQIDEKWWTKDAFNLAWSYYRTRRYDKAIDLMLQVHRKSENNKYVDMRGQVERDIGVFYVDAGRLNDAIKFYESRGINYTEQFVKIANIIVSQGRFSQAESLLNEAAKTEKDRDRKIEIYIAQLDLFDKYNKIPQHLEASKLLVKFHQETPLSEDNHKRLSYHVNKKAAELQKATASPTYANVPKVKAQKSREAIAYFDLSQQLNPAQKAEKIFFQAETAYAASQFGKALGFYVKSFDAAFENNEKKLLTQNLEGMLSSLGQPGLNQAQADKYYIPVYTRYLSVDSKTDRAKSIYVKLFNSQFDKGDVPAAEETMETFAKKHPSDFETQEGMLAKVMEHYRKKKDYTKVKAYVADINSGKYKVSKKYADALRSLMTKIQIEGVQQSLEKGDKSAALKGYHQIYNDAESTPKAKVNAGYNLAALYYEMGDVGQSYQWGTVAVKDMEPADVSKFADSFLSIAGGLFLRQHFSQSADLSYRVFAKLCKQNSNNKVVAYKNAVFIALSNNELDKAVEVRNYGRQCNLASNVVADVTLELMKDVAKAGRWDTYETLLKELDADPKSHHLLIRPMEELRKEHLKVGNVAEARELEVKQQKYFEAARAKKIEVPVDGLDLMAEKAMGRVRNLKNQVSEITLRFPETEFNNAVKAKLKILDQLTSEVSAIQKTGSGKGIVEGYRLMIEAYETFGEELKGFVPEGKSPEYVASFQKAMGDVYNPILTNARKHRNDVKKLIMENKILSASNYAVLYGRLESFKRFVTAKSVVLMDRGGQR
jgi:tetratricopeptide (TPR) repeat protein